MVVAERGNDLSLRLVEGGEAIYGERCREPRAGNGLCREPCGEVGFDVQNMPRGQRADVLGRARMVEQRDALG